MSEVLEVMNEEIKTEKETEEITEKKPSKVFSILSMSFGLSSLGLLLFMGMTTMLLPIASIIMACISRVKNGKKMDGMAKTGLITAIVSIVINILLTVFLILFFVVFFVIYLVFLVAVMSSTSGAY